MILGKKEPVYVKRSVNYWYRWQNIYVATPTDEHDDTYICHWVRKYDAMIAGNSAYHNVADQARADEHEEGQA